MRSVFIDIEGIDGSGGTTQARLLARWFESRGWPEVVLTCEPTDGPVGRFIRHALDPKDPAAILGDAVFPYLFAADRRDHLDRLVLPALERGCAVVTDRYTHSSLAYQSLSVGLAEVAALNARFPPADLVIHLVLDPEECLRRIQARGRELDRFEALDRLRRVQEAYDAVIVHARASGERVVRVDARGSVEAVHARVVAAVEDLLRERG